MRPGSPAFYAANLGRFMSPDWDAKPTAVPYATFGDPQTLNLYAYVENAPLNRVDADGHAAFSGEASNPWRALYGVEDLYAWHAYCLGSGWFPDDGLRQGDTPLETILAAFALQDAEKSLKSAQESAKAQQQNAGSSGASGGTPFTPVQSGGTTLTGTFDEFHGNRGSQGVTIEATPSGCSDCEWIQGVKSSGMNGGKQFIDGHEVMGNSPLYPIGGNGHNGLDDQPYRHSAGSFTAVAVFGHTDEKNHTFSAVGAITYGYSISSSGQLTTRAPAAASASQMSGVIRQVASSPAYSSWSVQ